MKHMSALDNELRDDSETMVKDSTSVFFSERRSGIKDRRKINTYIWNDRRSGIADRRRKTYGKTQLTLSENDIRRILS